MKAKNRLAVGLTTALTLVAALVWIRLDGRPAPDAPATAQSPAMAQSPAVAGAPSDPAVAIPSDDDIQATIDADPDPRGKLKTFPRCQWGTTRIYEDGSPTGESCAKSPHHDYSNETLEIMAYDDAEAARVLAMRLRHTDFARAMQLALRAVAISGGDTQVLLSAEVWRLPATANGPTPLEEASHMYIVHSLRQLVDHGEFRGNPAYVNRIRNLTDNPDATITELDRFVHQLYGDIRQIELDVTGNTTIGGEDDV